MNTFEIVVVLLLLGSFLSLLRISLILGEVYDPLNKKFKVRN